jgi:hypothetical protein
MVRIIAQQRGWPPLPVDSEGTLMKTLLSVLPAAIVVLAATSASLKSAEINDIENSTIGLNITVVSRARRVECRVDYKNKPVGSGSDYTTAGVARVHITLPEKYLS